MFRLLLLAVLLPVFGCAARPTRVAADLPPDVSLLNLLTYNVNYALAGDEPTLGAVAQADADVVCLQETTPEWESILRTNLARQFPHMEFKHSPGAGGLGVLAKLPIESVQ